MGKLNAKEVAFWLSEAKSCEERQLQHLIRRNNYPFLVNYYEGIRKINPQQGCASASRRPAQDGYNQ